ncbi:hypothetical protein J437_LFUL008149 [Ladona fulva]|uniref:NAD-dependent protein deacylase n=1 Tax=Ladona fulva TaxID=123851 RepID=A0A8K0JU83_LADFU|nr:hypothetical protein J437_LFUL008149 [Ladona fulva]
MLKFARVVCNSWKVSRDLLIGYGTAMASTKGQPISDMAEFRKVFQNSKHIVILTGAGVSAESGVPTFRGAGGFWRTYQATNLATPGAFKRDPSLVWEFYHYRRELVLTKKPNPAHVAIAELQKRSSSEQRRVILITQNIDGLHQKAGSENVIEIHGSLFKTRCTECGNVEVNTKSPICPALEGKGAPDPDADSADIKVEDLPHCNSCKGLLRPHVVWFGESLFDDVLDEVDEELNQCDLCLVVGTSSIVYPAAMFAPQVAARGVPVAEFNLEPTPVTESFKTLWGNYSSSFGTLTVDSSGNTFISKASVIPCWGK